MSLTVPLRLVVDEDCLRRFYDEQVADWNWYRENDPASGYPEQREDPNAAPPSIDTVRGELIDAWLDELCGDQWGYRIERATLSVESLPSEREGTP